MDAAYLTAEVVKELGAPRSLITIYDKYWNRVYSGTGDADTAFELRVVVDPVEGRRLVGRIESIIWSKCQD